MTNESFDRIKWHDDLINDIDCLEIFRYCITTPNWRIQQSYSGIRSDKKPQNMFWQFQIDHETAVVKNATQKVKSIVGNDYYIDECYVNGQSTLQEGSLHCDRNVDSSYTFLIYINPEWNITWGGCTVFINQYVTNNNEVKFFDDQKEMKCIRFTPQPKCGMLFPANYLHYAEAPTKYFTGIRMTLVYKLMKIK